MLLLPWYLSECDGGGSEISLEAHLGFDFTLKTPTVSSYRTTPSPEGRIGKSLCGEHLPPLHGERRTGKLRAALLSAKGRQLSPCYVLSGSVGTWYDQLSLLVFPRTQPGSWLQMRKSWLCEEQIDERCSIASGNTSIVIPTLLTKLQV